MDSASGTDATLLATLVERLEGARVLCAGDLMLDRFVYGQVDRISPEAPIPVVRVERETAMLGGAGNVLRNLAALGAKPAFLSVVGDDPPGLEVRRLLSDLRVDDLAVELVRDRPTTIKTRFFAGGQQMLRADREGIAPIPDHAADALLEAASAWLPSCGALVLSDYGKGVLTPDFTFALIEAARVAGTPVVVDPKGNDYSRYRGATVVTPNRKELAEASRMPVDGDDAIIAAARKIIATCGIDAVLATRSADGMSLVGRDGVDHFRADKREVFDVSGAGDTVVSCVAAALAAGGSLAAAAALSNHAGHVVVGKAGTAVAYPREILAELRHQGAQQSDEKLLTLAEAVERVDRWRRKGLRVGFTNGCFDLLHPGHISLLRQARGACDRLIVGLNTDQSVSRLKGPTRPVQNELARATVLGSLAAVDAVVLFGAETPIDLITALRPDLLVKGADYTVATVVGAEFVQSYGGTVMLAALEPGHSTTATIARMAS